VTIVPNSDGLTGGIALWQGVAEASSVSRERSNAAARKKALPKPGVRATRA